MKRGGPLSSTALAVADEPLVGTEPKSVPPAAARTVCVVESLTAIRQLTINYLLHLGGFKVVSAASTFDEGITACGTLRPDLAILDGCMWSETQGISLSRAIQAISPATKIVIFCPSAHPDLMRDAVDAGVSGFVLRSEGAAAFEHTIRTAMNGGQHYCDGVLEMLRHQRPAEPSPSEVLSPRERQVLQEIARGRLSKEIADSLGMSVFGVQNVRRRISRKTGLRTVAQLTLHAAKLHLVPEPTSR